ncbi:MAG: TonB-dependent receptor [Acidobacteria bacterium Pan2503]|uniref:TonB-dependent receptor n=1 Tax=Candidatus Acidiferrum panamense TaxID=2741543 RepID=A0A7V8NQU1_9BACT|nr:TonB-dependent receptor [Candidatus Acidoferrum panamensis]
MPAQSNTSEAQLSGRLTDFSGYGVGDVRITAELEGSPNAPGVSATSGPDGAYFLRVPPGRYRIHFAHTSFVPRDFVLDLAAGESHPLNLRLEIERLSESVVVTANAQPLEANRTPAPVDVLSHQEIEQRQAVSIPDLLQFSPGVAIGRTGPEGGTASIFLNGGNSDFTKVLVDGTPINPPGSAVDFSTLTAENIDKVEVVRGAESAIYGTDAVSGVIQLFTHRGETRVPAFGLYAEGGSYSSARGGGELSGLVGKFDYSAAASYFRTDGQGPNDAFFNRTLSGNFGYAFSQTNQLRLSLRNNTSDAGIPGPTLVAPPDLFQGYGQHILSIHARWDLATGPHWRHELNGTESYTRQHSFATPPDQFTYDTLLRFNRAGLAAQSTYIARSFSAAAGYQYEVENGGISFVSPGHLRRNNQGGYLDFRYSPVSRLWFDFGIRAEANASFGTRVVPRAGGSYLLHYGKGLFGDTRYRAFYGQGIKEPRFDQTFGTDPCFPGNPNLKPEASKGWSTGFDQKLVSDRLKLSADYFYNRFYDMVSFAPNPSPNPDFCGTYFNTDLAFARGVNFASELRMGKWLFVYGNYTYDDTRVLQSENAFGDPALVAGKPLIRRPVHSGSLGVNIYYARVNWNFIGYFSGVRTDTNFVNPSQTNNPGYARFDMAVRYNLIRGFLLTARATNLFDKQYQDVLGYPALGRDYRFGLCYQFSGRN